MHRQHREGYFHLLRPLLVGIGLFGCSLAPSFAYSPPPTVSDRALGLSIREEFKHIRDQYEQGLIPLPRANTLAAEAASKALSPGGLRWKRYFPNGVFLDFMRDDISRIVDNTLTGNKSNWHGFYRELKYINFIQSPDSPFELIEAGTRQKISDGRLVEFDILVQHKGTGARMVIESKDWKIASRADLGNAKEQIAKIAIRAREEGVSRVTWMNRQPIPDAYRGELMRFGERKGVGIYDNVTTGLKESKALHISEILDKESKQLTQKALERKARMLTVRGALLIESGIFVHKTWQWRSGKATTRELVSTGGGAAGGIAGVASGTWIGASIGSFFPGAGTAIGGVVGGFVGGITGHFAGKTIATYAAEKLFFEKQTEQEKQATFDALIAHYTRISRG